MGFLVCFAVLGLFCITGLPEVNAITNMQFVSFAIQNGAEFIGENQRSPYPEINLPGKINDPLNLTAMLKSLEEYLGYGLSLQQLESGCKCTKSSCMCSFIKTFTVAAHKFTLNVSAIAIFKSNYTEVELQLTVNGRMLVDKTIPVNLEPLCFPIPLEIPLLNVNLCGQLYDLNVESKSVCVKGYLEIKIPFKTFTIKIGSACMKIPIFLHATSDILVRANAEPLLGKGKLLELFEILQQEEYSLISL